MTSAAYSFDWEDCTGTFQVGGSLVQGNGYWPSMVNVDATELSGSITGNDARSLAAVLVAAADACDRSNDALFEREDAEVKALSEEDDHAVT